MLYLCAMKPHKFTIAAHRIHGHLNRRGNERILRIVEPLVAPGLVPLHSSMANSEDAEVLQ